MRTKIQEPRFKKIVFKTCQRFYPAPPLSPPLKLWWLKKAKAARGILLLSLNLGKGIAQGLQSPVGHYWGIKTINNVFLILKRPRSQENVCKAKELFRYSWMTFVFVFLLNPYIAVFFAFSAKKLFIRQKKQKCFKKPTSVYLKMKGVSARGAIMLTWRWFWVRL